MVAGIPPNFLGMPAGLILVLVQTGLPGVALTLNIGQLVINIGFLFEDNPNRS